LPPPLAVGGSHGSGTRPANAQKGDIVGALGGAVPGGSLGHQITAS
jgi:hypothetical protein